MKLMPAWVLILLAGSAAYASSLGAGFVFDDLPFIVDNPLARSPWPLTGSFRNTIRPLVQWTFSLNYAEIASNPGSACWKQSANTRSNRHAARRSSPSPGGVTRHTS